MYKCLKAAFVLSDFKMFFMAHRVEHEMLKFGMSLAHKKNK